MLKYIIGFYGDRKRGTSEPPIKRDVNMVVIRKGWSKTKRHGGSSKTGRDNRG